MTPKKQRTRTAAEQRRVLSQVRRRIAEPPTPTPAAEWRREREEGVPLTLPSGNTARIRSINFDTLLKYGRLPDPLTPAVHELLTKDPKKDALADLNNHPEDLAPWLALVDAVTLTCFVQPKVLDIRADALGDRVLADDEILLEDVPLGDKMYLLNLFYVPVTLLGSFRPEQESDVGSVAGAEDPGTAGEPDLPDTPVGEVG